jgi:hypothetical protein
MPLKLNVSLSKKIGQPDFGSLGASCSVEVELPHDIISSDLATFHRQARNAYVACAQAVNDELARRKQADGAVASSSHSPPVNGNGENHRGANGRASSSQPNGNGHRRAGGRRATASQVRAIHAIASRQGLDLAATLHERYGIDRPEDLAISEASQLIDALKAPVNGAGGRG